MGCSYQWTDDDHLIMDIVIEAPWTWTEFMSQAGEVFAIIKAEGKSCATAVDVINMGTMPPGNILRNLTEIENMMPANIFASAIVGAPYMVTVFMDILTKMRPRAQRIALFTKTRTEAHEKIMERYAKLKASSDSGS